MRVVPERNSFAHVVALLCALAFALYVFEHRTYFASTVDRLNMGSLVIAASTISLQIILRAWRDVVLYRSIGVSVPIGVIHSILIRQNLLNYLPMKIGTVYAAAEVKTRLGISWGNFTAIVVSQNVLTLAVSCSAAGMALLVSESRDSAGAAAIFLAVGLLSMIAFLIRIPAFIELPLPIRRFVEDLHRGMNALVRDLHRLAVTSVVSMLAVLLSAWRFQLLAAAGGEFIDYSAALVFAVGIYASLFISITPAALGVREGLVGGVALLLELSVTAAVVASALDRVLVLMYCGAVAVVGAVAPTILRKMS